MAAPRPRLGEPPLAPPRDLPNTLAPCLSALGLSGRLLLHGRKQMHLCQFIVKMLSAVLAQEEQQHSKSQNAHPEHVRLGKLESG